MNDFPFNFSDYEWVNAPLSECDDGSTDNE